MFKSELKSKFKSSQGDLLQLGYDTLALTERDAQELAIYGINNEQKESLLQSVTAFATVQFDELYEQRQMLATDIKNGLASELKTIMRQVMIMLESAYSTNNIMYVSLRNTEISKMTDTELVIKAKSTAQILNENISYLQQFGVTAEIIANLNSKADNLSEKLKEQTVAIQNRDNATQLRINIANNLYEKISKIRNIGRKMWIEKDEALSNDYVIYDNSSNSGNDDVIVADDPVDGLPDDNG